MNFVYILLGFGEGREIADNDLFSSNKVCINLNNKMFFL